MIRQIKTEVLELTPEIAHEFARMEPCLGERPLNPKRLKWHEALIRAGEFYNPHWARIVFQGRTLRGDGQHSSTVLSSIARNDPASFPSNLQVVIDVYEVDSQNEMARIFDIFNNPNSARSAKDKLAFYAGFFADEHPALRSVDITLMGRCLAGMAFSLAQAERREKGQENATASKIGARERGCLLNPEFADGIPFVTWAQQFADCHNSKFLGKPAIAARMYEHYRDDRDSAEVFWGFVLREDHPDADHETREFARKLRDSEGRRGREARYYLNTTDRYWRAFRRLQQAA